MWCVTVFTHKYLTEEFGQVQATPVLNKIGKHDYCPTCIYIILSITEHSLQVTSIRDRINGSICRLNPWNLLAVIQLMRFVKALDLQTPDVDWLYAPPLPGNVDAEFESACLQPISSERVVRFYIRQFPDFLPSHLLPKFDVIQVCYAHGSCNLSPLWLSSLESGN